MANKKNLPNIPIYIGDWERDCNVLSLESEAAWMRIVFKLWTKGKQNSIKIPTKSIQNLWRCSDVKMREILSELLYNEICLITESDGFIEFTCRRFVKENKLSKIRSEAGKGNKKEKKSKSNSKQTLNKNEQNADYDIENEIDYDIENEIDYDYDNDTVTELYPTFEDFWNDYDKKIGRRDKIEKKWNKLSQQIKEEIMEFIPKYKISQPDKQFRKNPETFLNNESWNDELIIPANKKEMGSMEELVYTGKIKL